MKNERHAKMNPGRRVLRLAALLVLVFTCGFVLGWPTVKREIFPYPQLVAVRDFLRRHGIDEGPLVVADGSGLSRGNRIKAACLQPSMENP